MSGASTPVAPSLMDCPELDAAVWNELGPGLRKLYGLEAVASDPGLTGVDKSVFAWISSHADDMTATAYPSLSTLARLIQCTRRNVIRAVGRLERAGYVVVAERGRPGRSSRYRLTFKGARSMKAWKRACSERGAFGDSPVTITPASMVTVVVTHGDQAGSHMVTALSPEATHQPGHEAGVDGGWLPSTASPSTAAVGDAPGGAPPSASNGQIHNAWFFSVFPKRVNVAKADRLLTDMLRDGVVGQDALAAAALAYARYVLAKHWPDDIYVIAPCNFLRDHRWLDDWTVQEKPATPAAKTKKRKPAKGAAKTAAPKKPVGQAPQQRTPAPAPKPVESRKAKKTRVEAEDATRARCAKHLAEEKERMRLFRESENQRAAAKAAEAAVAKAAEAAEAGKREQAKRSLEAWRRDDALEEFRSLRPGLLATFAQRDLEDDTVGVVGLGLDVVLYNAGVRLRGAGLRDSRGHTACSVIGRAIRKGPDDEDCYRLVFEDAEMHDAELLLNAAKSYMKQWTASRAAEDSKSAGPKRVGLALVGRADEEAE